MALNAWIGLLAFALVSATPGPRPTESASCGAIDLVDQAALARRPPLATSDPPPIVLLSEVARIWGAEPDALPIAGEAGRVTAEIRSRQSAHMSPVEYAYRAVRMDGTWRVAVATTTLDEAMTTVREPDQVLSPQAGRALDTILAGPCLWRAPRTLGSWVPIPGGRLESIDTGVQSQLDIRAGGRRWLGFYSKVNLGPAGQIANLLHGEAPRHAHDDSVLIRRANIP